MSDTRKSRRKSDGKDADKPAGPDRDVGATLRSVYASVVNEEIPSDIDDLLRKLG